MVRIVLAGLAGGLVVFVWGAVSWMGLPFHTKSLHNVPQSEVLIAHLKSAGAPTAVYHYPGFLHDESGTPVPAERQNAWFEQHRGGPYIPLLNYRAEGFEPFAARQFLVGLLVDVTSAMFAAWLLCATGRTFATYRARVLFVAGLGVFATLTINVQQWNWMRYPAEFALPGVIDAPVAWLLAGLVIARIARPRTPTPAPEVATR